VEIRSPCRRESSTRRKREGADVLQLLCVQRDTKCGALHPIPTTSDHTDGFRRPTGNLADVEEEPEVPDAEEGTPARRAIEDAADEDDDNNVLS
jgi:hypothetical protein